MILKMYNNNNLHIKYTDYSYVNDEKHVIHRYIYYRRCHGLMLVLINYRYSIFDYDIKSS